MKIGLVCPYNIFTGGGVQECVIALREGLVRRGHEAYIITPRPNDYLGHENDAGIILLGSARKVKAAHTSAQVSISIETDKINEMLDQYNFDLIHFHEPWIPMISMQIMSRSDAIHVATFHAAMSERRTSKTVEKIIIPYTKSIFKYIDTMTAVSDTATNYVRSLTDREIKIVPNGIDLNKYKADNDSSKNRIKTILYIGRLEKRKGVKYLLEAFGKLYEKDNHYKLLIAGTGPDREKLELQMLKDKIKNVEFLGYVSEKQKLKLLEKSDIFVSPAIHGESFGIVLLEAMAKGCVAVAGNNGGYESVMTDFGQISLVNPKDTKEFARRLDFLAKDKAVRKLWRNWAKQNIEQYSYDKIVDMYEQIYEDLYAKRQ